ncbi:coatomer subunit zeta-2 [Suncus etruscus]|uniref:coatomer subunit zeta-2 n=1 Tax=Suncus etruscus TaxID=109475 RepID=UPI0021102DCC|nr:coatomer subunit zeta-2 [Suncus etruscus]
MQRPEAWPRPHPGEGAGAVRAGGLTPPAPAGEPPGPRLQEPSLYTIKAVFILDNDGRRLLAKYYDDTFPSIKEQMVFEKNVFSKTNRTDAEIAFFGGMTIVYKSSIDLFLYVVGSSQENELMLMSVLTCLFESLNHILRKNVEKRWLLENMDGAFLVLDEIVDGGVILESDPQQVIQKVNFRTDDCGLTEQSVAQGQQKPECPKGLRKISSPPDFHTFLDLFLRSPATSPDFYSGSTPSWTPPRASVWPRGAPLRDHICDPVAPPGGKTGRRTPSGSPFPELSNSAHCSCLVPRRACDISIPALLRQPGCSPSARRVSRRPWQTNFRSLLQ